MASRKRGGGRELAIAKKYPYDHLSVFCVSRRGAEVAEVSKLEKGYLEMIDTQLTEQIIGCAIHVHRELGPGLLESVYEIVLAHQLEK